MTEKIGDISQGKWDEGSWQKTALHAAAGAIEAAVAKGDIGAGALAGAANEQLIGLIKDDLRKAVDSQYPKNPSKEQAAQAEAEYRSLMEAASTLTGLTVGALASGGDTKTATMAGNIALTATDNNYLKHKEIKELIKAKSDCAAGNNSQACARVKELQSLSAERDAALDACSGNASARCNGLRQEVRTAFAEIIRQGDLFKSGSFTTYYFESKKTETEAMQTLSKSDYGKGVGLGLWDSLVVSPIKSLIEASRPLAMQQAYTEGNATLQDVEKMQSDVNSKLKNVYAALSNPDVWSKMPQAMRNSVADAIEKGDAQALGKIDGEVLGFVGSLAVPGGGVVGSTGKVTKTTEVLTDVAKVGKKTAEESIAVAANGEAKTARLLDSTTPTGATVHHGSVSTAIGSDEATMINFQRATDTGSGHNLIVHGSRPDYDEFGGLFWVEGNPTNPQHIVDAVLSNPSYQKGAPVSLGSCWSASNGTAQQVADGLNATVTAPTRPVFFNSTTGQWEQASDFYMNIYHPDLIHIQPEMKVFYPNPKPVE